MLEVNRELGARLTDFAGWEMPLQFSGIIAEHRAVRSDVGVFDVSHLGKLLVTGPGANDAVQIAVTADVDRIEAGRASYALVLAEDGGCIDDVFVYRLAADELLVVPNAANVEAVADAITTAGGDVADAWDRWAIVALQGPNSGPLFDKVFPGSPAGVLRLHSWCELDFEGRRGLVARTGYTGERGFELYIPAGDAPEAYRALIDAGATPVGLGARDTLRLEMGYALYGHELTRAISPLEANLSWAIAWDAPFRGRAALERVRADGPERRAFALVCRDKGVPRAGYSVIADDTIVGTVTSGNHSPTLNTGIALALGPAATRPAEGDRVTVSARGRSIPADIVKPPFVRRGRG